MGIGAAPRPAAYDPQCDEETLTYEAADFQALLRKRAERNRPISVEPSRDFDERGL